MERKRTDTIPRYDPEALRANIERCKVNIKRMEEARDKELEMIARLLKLLAEVEKA